MTRSAAFLTKTSMIAAAAALMAVPAYAQSSDKTGAYANLGFTQLSGDLDLSDLSAQGTTIDLGQENVKVNTITGRLGYRMADFFAVEVEGGLGLGGDTIQRTIPVTVPLAGTVNIDADADLDITNYGVVFARGILPLGDSVDIFGRVGYGFAKAEANVTGTTAALPGFTATATDSESVNDFAYGVGAQYNLNDRHGVRLDYAAIGSDFSVISASYAIKF